MADLSVKIAGVEFPNPVIAASGTYGNFWLWAGIQ